MGVGAREAERADPGDAGLAVALPRHGIGDDLDRQPVPRNVRRGLLEVEMPRQHLVLQRQDDLDDPGDPGGRLEVADVRLDRADQQRPVGGAPGTEHRTRGLSFDRVAQRRPGAVGFQVTDVGGVDPGAIQRIGDHPLLSHAVGHRQPARGAVLVDGTAADDRADPVAVAKRILEAFDDDDAAALAAHIAVGGCVERLAPAVGRQHVRAGEGDHRGGREQHVGPTGQRQVALAEAERLARLVDGDQRRTAGGVDGDRRPLQPQPEADPARGGRVGRPDGHVGLDLGVGEFVGGHAQVIVGGQPDEHAGVAAGQRRRRDPGVLDRAPRGLQQQPVLGVHQPDLAGRHPEERSVEARRVVDETRAPGDHLARRARLRVEELVDVPAVTGDLGDGVAACPQHVPEPVGVRGAREARRVADDGEPRGLPGRLLGGSHAVVLPCFDGENLTAQVTCRALRSTSPDGHYGTCAGAVWGVAVPGWGGAERWHRYVDPAVVGAGSGVG